MGSGVMEYTLLSDAPEVMHADRFRAVLLKGCTCDPVIALDELGVAGVSHDVHCELA